MPHAGPSVLPLGRGRRLTLSCCWKSFQGGLYGRVGWYALCSGSSWAIGAIRVVNANLSTVYEDFLIRKLLF